MLEQFRIADFIEWHENKTLNLNPDFQRGEVWTPPARIMLIDTILRNLPVPKIFIRTKIDKTKRISIKEIVDGQQRLRAILDFANDKITLSRQTIEFSGLRFTTLPEELQDKFLSYPLAVDQLINASDAVVLDIFARLNSYNVKLNAPELRHAAYQGDFKTAAHNKALGYFDFWSSIRIFTNREMVRMEHDALVAEMMVFMLQGVSDGGAGKIDKAYKTYDPDGKFDRESIEKNFDSIMKFVSDELATRIGVSAIFKPPHLLMLFAAVAHSMVGIPKGSLDILPDRKPVSADINLAADRLWELGAIISSSEEPETHKDFWRASRATTQRVASRKLRFQPIYDAITA